MIYVALLEGVAIMVVAVSFASILRWHIRQSARREDLLVNQVCSLAGKPWLPAPSQERTVETIEDLGRYVTMPDYLPDSDL